MKAVSAICPGSCGELVQGFVNGRSLLVSCPVDMYSEVRVYEGRRHRVSSSKYCKLEKALAALLKLADIPSKYLDSLCYDVKTQLPPGKGMGSSTADIGAAVAAAAVFFGYPITPEQIAKIAVSIEPTDSTILPGLTLFDHIYGDFIEYLGSCPDIYVVVLEAYGVVDTREFHDRIQIKRPAGAYLSEADGTCKLLKAGIKHRDAALIGEAAMASARANQSILPKPWLEEVIDTALRYNAAGVNIAHSGTVAGVLVDPSRGDVEKILNVFSGSRWESCFEKVFITRMINGGVRIKDGG